MAVMNGTDLVRAARNGDLEARDRLVTAHLPLVYNIVGRALNGHHDVDDVVQETMLRALDGLGTLRSPDSFRSWLVAITMNTLRAHWHSRRSGQLAGALDDARDLAHPGADFVELTVARLHLSGQRRETAEATRWLAPEDSALLSLWWLECAGELTRHEVAAALELSPEHTAVRVQRMKEQLETARIVVRALGTAPLCPDLRTGLAGWDGRPSALWRKRIARHARTCPHCAGLRTGLVPAEGLLAGLLLVPPAATLLAAFRERAGLGLVASAQEAGVGAGAGSGVGSGAAPGAGAVPGARSGARHAAGSGSGSRGARRRERERRRGRRRAVAAAGIAVVAVAGGTLYLATGPEDGENDSADTARAAAPGVTATTTASPAAPTTSPSATASKTPSASAEPSSHSPRPTPSRTTHQATGHPTKAPESRPQATKTAGGQTGSGSGTGSGAGSGSGSGASSTSQQVIALVNTERSRAGCGPLTGNALLTRAAQGQSDDMAARDFFDHTNPDGDGPGERVTAAGYQWSTYGENIAKGQRTPAEVMEAWMNSPGHRANILNCDFREIGIGLHTGGGPYWTQVFGAR
ncbi:sigma-70 family RNA polymerase sigma factor [Streptomyces sp. NPDC046203]|uniref:sigma-70 family RNA polymerase sigma factor n=1 Tax=Streptomyces sp. NPDC046203 TaxID=3154602 RepID=UPI0033E60742